MMGVVLVMAGCGDLLSVHALYTVQDRVFDSALEGRWQDNDTMLTVERAEGCYKVATQSKKGSAERREYEMHLVDIGGVRFADLLPADGYIGHLILKVRVTEGQLHFAFFDSEWLRQRVPHETAEVANNDKLAVLTISTPELRKLAQTYGSEPKAFDEGATFHR